MWACFALVTFNFEDLTGAEEDFTGSLFKRYNLRIPPSVGFSEMTMLFSVKSVTVSAKVGTQLGFNFTTGFTIDEAIIQLIIEEAPGLFVKGVALVTHLVDDPDGVAASIKELKQDPTFVAFLLDAQQVAEAFKKSDTAGYKLLKAKLNKLNKQAEPADKTAKPVKGEEEEAESGSPILEAIKGKVDDIKKKAAAKKKLKPTAKKKADKK